MGISWAKNMSGLSLSDEKMQDIPAPRLELVTHVTIKCVQAFGLLGACAVAPISAMVKPENRNWPEIHNRMALYGKNGMILGLCVGPLMSAMRMRSYETEDEVRDRCYRLRRNRNQVRVDQLSVLGAGGGSGATSRGGFGYSDNIMFGCVVGMSTGIIVATLLNTVIPA